MKKAFAAAGVVLLSFMLSPKAMASNFTQFYIFGDSLSETGNLFNATGGAIPPNPPYAPGRFSNGDIWVDFVGDELGLTPSLIPTPGNTNIPTEGINFAVGGSFSGSGSENVFPLPDNVDIPGILGQVDLFLNTSNQQTDPNALYAVWGGANDYLFGDVTNPNQAVNQTVSNLTNAITSLADAGAKNIAVFNLPDLGQIPVSIAQGDRVSTGLTQLTQGHNTALDQGLDVLSANSDVNIIRVDINSLFNEVASNPGEFGFTQDPNVPCLIGVIGNLTSVCDNPNEFISFDGFHPTSRSHRLVANEVLSAINHKTVPESSTVLSTIAVGAIATAGVLKRKRKKIMRSKS